MLCKRASSLSNLKYKYKCRWIHVEGKRNVIYCWWECKLAQLLQELWVFLKTLKIEHPYHSAIAPTPWHTPEGLRVCVSLRYLHSHGFYSLVHNSRIMEPAYVCINRWVKEVWGIYTVAFCSATKRKGIVLLGGKWTELELVLNKPDSKPEILCVL